MSTPEPTQAQRYDAFEKKWLEQCMYQRTEGRMIVEMMTIKGGRGLAVIVRHFDANVKRSKVWPELIACTVYLPSDQKNTWESLDEAMQAYVIADPA